MSRATEANACGKDKSNNPRSVVNHPSADTMIAAAPCQYWWPAMMTRPKTRMKAPATHVHNEFASNRPGARAYRTRAQSP